MNPNPVQHDDVDTASTRPSATRTVMATLPIGTGATPNTTTLPVVHWNEAGATLESSAMPRYEQLQLLGEGGMGEVVLARDNDIGREVAVKRLHGDLQHPEIFARFVEEVRTVGQLEHPNIVPIHDAGIDSQGYFFVMKKVEGETLAAIIERLSNGDPVAHARWPMERRVDVIRKVLEALRYAHTRGVVHRDIKPANIHVGPLGEVFLLDWGIARRERGGAPDRHAQTPGASAPDSPLHTRAGAVMGTPMYMSPEQARGEVADARSDLYSLCLTLYEFVTLRHPFTGLGDAHAVMQAVVSQPIPHAAFQKHPAQRSSPMDLSWVLHKGVSKDRALRYQSADELIRRLDDRAEGNVPIQCHITATKRLSYEFVKLTGRYPFVWLGMLLAAVFASAYWLAVR